jgi:DNA sulfur modification protein DndB
MDITVRVPATKGRMGKSDYFVALFPLKTIPALFTYDPEKMAEFTPEMRSQRRLKDGRVPDIASYILDHEDWIFSSLTVSFDDRFSKFAAINSEHPDIGILELPLGTVFTVNDGQHRAAGIAEALKADSTLGDHSISVVLIPNRDLKRSQQMFSDLNRTVHKTSKSLDILYDHRDPLNRITLAVIEQVPLFKGRVDKDAVSLSPKSRHFATLSGLYAANEQLLGEQDEDISDPQFAALRQFAIEFWKELCEVIIEWDRIVEGDLKPHEARTEFVSSYALALYALGSLGHTLKNSHPNDWKQQLQGLTNVDWRKSNKEWQRICMLGSEVITRQPTRLATAQFLKWKLGLGEKPKTVLEAV